MLRLPEIRGIRAPNQPIPEDLALSFFPQILDQLTLLELQHLCLSAVRPVSRAHLLDFPGELEAEAVFRLCCNFRAVRWYLRHSLSLRDVEELLEERGLEADHTTVWRWVQRYGPELEQRLRRHLKPANKSWRVDETYLLVQRQMVVPVPGDRFLSRHHRYCVGLSRANLRSCRDFDSPRGGAGMTGQLDIFDYIPPLP